MALFLTDSEIRELTGLQRQSAQARWLTRNGIKHSINAEGRPRVLRSHIERLLGGGETQRQRSEPDAEALRKFLRDGSKAHSR